MRQPSSCSCSRRSFLRGCGVTLAGFGITSLFPKAFMDQAMAQTLSATDRRLMFIFMRGGNDAVNTLIPHGDADYNTINRPTLYIPPAESIDLNGFASLNPKLVDMMDGFNAGDLAILHRVGYPNNSRSHFDGQRIWENGDPTQPQLFQGWLYRYIQEHAVPAGVELPVLSVQGTPPIILKGQEGFVNVANPDSFDYIFNEPKRTKFATGWRDIHANLLGLEPYRPILSQTGVKLVDILDEYRTWDQGNWDPKDPVSGDSLFPVSTATNPDDPTGPGGKKFSPSSYTFFRGVKVCALALLESDAGNNNGTRIVGTELGGWDTHNGQGQLNGGHAERLTWLGYAYRSLRIVLSGAATDPRNYPAIWDKTVITTLSEFGRTSKENGSIGTDHAAAGCLFVQGGCVNGGVYNCDAATWPPGVMFGVNNRYLLERTDYRAIFWELLRDQMGALAGNVETVFPGYTALGLGAQEPGLINCPVPQPAEIST